MTGGRGEREFGVVSMREAQATPTGVGVEKGNRQEWRGVEIETRGKDGIVGRTDRYGFSLGGDAKPNDGRQFGNAERGVPDTSSDEKTKTRRKSFRTPNSKFRTPPIDSSGIFLYNRITSGWLLNEVEKADARKFTH